MPAVAYAAAQDRETCRSAHGVWRGRSTPRHASLSGREGLTGVTLQNRVTPLGDLVAEPGRGLVYGNRGCLHDREGTIVRGYNGRRWISCRLEFRGRRRHPLVQPGRYTGLFFLDEVTALAAGHRPCALCRRDDYLALLDFWRTLRAGESSAEAIHAQLHAERLSLPTRTRRLHEAAIERLPDGTFILERGAPRVVLGERLYRWTAAGYADPIRRPRRGSVCVITPPSLVGLLQAGWNPGVPLIHPSAPGDGGAVVRASDNRPADLANG